jgi:lysophospholipase L1-like esterase
MHYDPAQREWQGQAEAGTGEIVMGKSGRTIREYALIIVATVLAAEFLAFGALTWRSAASSGLGLAAATRQLLLQHPWLDQRVRQIKTDSEYQFLPTTQLAFRADTEFSGLKVGRWGFILNTDDQPAPFPDKPDDLTRIVLLGGSSAAGATATGNARTIAARLEALLNQAEEGAFQVLNFGVGGNYSYGELMKLVTEVAYLQPDVIIMFDGFNDAHYANLEHLRAGLPKPLMNWADFSYQYFDTMAGLRGQLRAPPPILTYSYLLVASLAGNDARSVREQREEMYAGLTATALSAWIAERDPGFASVLPTNLDIAASWASRNGIGFIGYLQPHPWEFKDLGCERAAGVQLMVGRLGPTVDEARYAQVMREAFQGYAAAYSDLDAAYAGTGQVRFIDLRDLFADTADCIYNDPIHYNDAGNLAIATRMQKDLLALGLNRAMD